MSFTWRILGVAYEQYVLFKRQWMWLAQSVIASAGLAILFSVWGGLEALRHIAVVLAVVGGWGVGINVAAQFIGWDKVSESYEKRVASPLTPIEYLVGSVLGSMLPFMISEAPLAALIWFMAGLSALSLLLLLLLAVAATFVGLFLALAIVLRIKSPMNISAVTNPLHTLTTMLPPVYYPPTMVPEPIRSFCAAIPTTALVDLGRAMSGQPAAYPATVSALSVAAWMIAALLLTKFKFRWGLE